jgi:hypothetical protein
MNECIFTAAILQPLIAALDPLEAIIPSSAKSEHFCQFRDPCKNCPFGTFFWPVERLC